MGVLYFYIYFKYIFAQSQMNSRSAVVSHHLEMSHSRVMVFNQVCATSVWNGVGIQSVSQCTNAFKNVALRFIAKDLNALNIVYFTCIYIQFSMGCNYFSKQ